MRVSARLSQACSKEHPPFGGQMMVDQAVSWIVTKVVQCLVTVDSDNPWSVKGKEDVRNKVSCQKHISLPMHVSLDDGGEIRGEFHKKPFMPHIFQTDISCCTKQNRESV